MIRSQYRVFIAAAFACVTAWAPQSTALAQVPPASEPSGGAPRVYSAAELETLVGPFALYPDDLVAIILPASTYPLQIVQADRFLDKRKANPKLPIEEGWDDSVKTLVNYPDVVKKMSTDLEWTEALGEAVVSNNNAVMDAVQAFRRKAQSAGSLKSNDKQTIAVEQQVIRIEQADPTVIYVPRYEPSEVIVVGAPVYPYYPTAYPVYHYPYPPGAALATGLIFGAALGAAWNGGRYGANYGGGNNNITINRGGNTVNTGGNVNRGGRSSTVPANTWKPTKQPGQVGGAGNRPATPRVGDPRPGGGSGAGSLRPSQGDIGRGGGPSASTRPAGGDAGRGGGAFGGMDSGAGAHRASARGAESRGSFGGSAGGGGMQAARGGGGAGQFAGGRPAGGGGARAGGGGGGRGGGGRGR
jgi:hypothetical protein